jgi:hypothetical protein
LESSRSGSFAAIFSGFHGNCDKIHQLKDIRQLTQFGA